jgi:hypothetical protein
VSHVKEKGGGRRKPPMIEGPHPFTRKLLFAKAKAIESTKVCIDVLTGC